MEKIKISVHGATRLHDYLLDHGDDENDFYKEERQFLLNIKDGFEVETAKEYFDIIDKILEITDGDIVIYNGGRLIDVWNI